MPISNEKQTYKSNYKFEKFYQPGINHVILSPLYNFQKCADIWKCTEVIKISIELVLY